MFPAFLHNYQLTCFLLNETVILNILQGPQGFKGNKVCDWGLTEDVLIYSENSSLIQITVLYLDFQGDRGKCGPPGVKGDNVWIFFIQIQYLCVTDLVLIMGYYGFLLQGLEGPPGPQGQKGDQVV